MKKASLYVENLSASTLDQVIDCNQKSQMTTQTDPELPKSHTEGSSNIGSQIQCSLQDTRMRSNKPCQQGPQMLTRKASLATQDEEYFNETFTNIPERPVIYPKKISEVPEAVPEVPNMTAFPTDSQNDATDSFYDDLPGIED